MRIQRLWFCLAGLALLAAGCASSGKPPKYVTNFNKVHPGMTKSQVSKLLGMPTLASTRSDDQVHVNVPDPQDPWAAFRQDVEGVFSNGELWQYGKFGLRDWQEPPELMDGSPKAFRIYFDNHGKVTRARTPAEGPYASPAQQGPRRSSSPADLWEGDAFGRDKANVGPTTQP